MESRKSKLDFIPLAVDVVNECYNNVTDANLYIMEFTSIMINPHHHVSFLYAFMFSRSRLHATNANSQSNCVLVLDLL